MEKLLYIGKSNKKFTHDKLYVPYYLHGPIVVRSNKGLVTFRKQHKVYFEENFKIVDEKEQETIIRRNKLKKIKHG